MSWAEFSTAIVNTLVVMVCVVAVALPVSLLLAITMVRTNLVGRQWAWLALFSQLLVPLYALVGAWSAGFGTQGWWPLSQVTVAGNMVAGLAAVSFIHAMAAIPAGVMILSVGLYWTRRSREEMALLEGGKRRVLQRVLLPELSGWIAATGLWMIVPVLTEMVVTNLYQVPTLPEQVYLDISLGSDTPQTYIVAVSLCTVPILLMTWLLRHQLPSLSTQSPQIAEHAPQVFQLRAWRWPVSLAVWLLILMIVVVPLMNLLIKAGWESRLGTDGWMQHRWTASRLLQTLKETSTQFTGEFQWSFTLAATSASVALATAAAMRAACGLAPQARLLMIFNITCLMLIACPGPLVAAGLMRLFITVPGLGWLYDHTLVAPIVAQQSRLLPLAWLIVGGILSTISRQAWEQAQVDQLSWQDRCRILIWRPTRALWCLAWLLLATLSIGELSTHLLLLPPGVTTVAQRLFELLHFGMRYQDSGLCLALVALGWLVAAVSWVALAKRSSASA